MHVVSEALAFALVLTTFSEKMVGGGFKSIMRESGE